MAFFALAALGFPIWASADPIITVTNLSLASTRAEACDAAGCTYTDNTWHSGDALLSTAESTRAASHAYASAAVNTNVADPLNWSGSGSSSAQASSESATSYGEAYSRFTAVFTLSAPQMYSFNSTFDVDGPEASWQVYLLNTRGELMYGDQGDWSGAIAHDGTLTAGLYGLTVIGLARPFAGAGQSLASHSGFDLRMSFADSSGGGGGSQTPEPASMLLLGSGLAGALARRSIRRRLPL